MMRIEDHDPEISYDKYGRMMYNPDFHPNQGTLWSKEDLIYLCSMHDRMFGGMRSLSLALGRTQMTCASKVMDMKKQGRYEYYRKLGEA